MTDLTAIIDAHIAVALRNLQQPDHTQALIDINSRLALIEANIADLRQQLTDQSARLNRYMTTDKLALTRATIAKVFDDERAKEERKRSATNEENRLLREQVEGKRRSNDNA